MLFKSNVRKEKHGILCAVAAAVAAVVLMIASPSAKMEAKAVEGIDVSAWQGAINWQQVKNAGYSFVMVRCGNTAYGIDSYFGYNMSQAAAAGLKTGIYCYTYAQTVEQAVQDATLVINACEPYTVSYPIAIDFEDSSLKGLNPTQQAEIVNAFCTTIYNAGYYPMVYCSKNWFETRLGPVQWDHWVAQYNSTCDYTGAYTMWQYSSRGSVAGISGYVDMDHDYKNYSTVIPDHGWDNRNNNTYYIMNYKRVVGYQTIDGRLYYFDPNTAVLYAGWLTDEKGQKYYFDPTINCAALVGWGNIEGKAYYFDANAHAVTGKQTIDGASYLFNADNTLYVGWYDEKGARYYYDPQTGKMTLGFAHLGNATYYFNPQTGVMTTGFATIDGATFYFGADGVMLVGMQNIGGKTYYFDPASGAMQTGYIKVGNAYYYFGADGVMQTGLIAIGGKYYYFGADGAMQTGLVPIKGANYYFNPVTGEMQTGLVDIGGKYYYFGADGAMQTGLIAIGKSFYYFAADGSMQTGFTQVGTDFYYFAKTGEMKTGWQSISGGYFYFGADGKLVRDSLFYDNTGNLVQVDANGLLILPQGYKPKVK